jgi:hypothetical protein
VERIQRGQEHASSGVANRLRQSASDLFAGGAHALLDGDREA